MAELVKAITELKDLSNEELVLEKGRPIIVLLEEAKECSASLQGLIRRLDENADS